MGTQTQSPDARRSLTHATQARVAQTPSASRTGTTPTANALPATREIRSCSARRESASTTTTAAPNLPALTSSAVIPALAPVASLLSARFATIDPSAVVLKVTLGILSQPASAALWLELNSRDQNQSLEA